MSVTIEKLSLLSRRYQLPFALLADGTRTHGGELLHTRITDAEELAIEEFAEHSITLSLRVPEGFPATPATVDKIFAEAEATIAEVETEARDHEEAVRFVIARDLF